MSQVFSNNFPLLIYSFYILIAVPPPSLPLTPPSFFPFSQPFQLGLDAFFITETIVYVLLIYLNDSDYLDFKIEKCWDGNAQSFGFLRSITV